MKEITPENRQKIFALYLGTQGKIENCKSTPITFENITSLSHWGQILVNPLTLITYENAKECYRLACFNNTLRHYFFENEDGISWVLHNEKFPSTPNHVGTLPQTCVDFLRSCGYALPYLNWSIDELVQAGVFKLKS